MRRTGKAIGTLAAATSLAMLGGGVAVADTVDLGSNMDVPVGTSAQISVGLIATAKDGSVDDVPGCNATEGDPVTVALTSDQGWATLSVGSVQLINCTTSVPVTVAVASSAPTATANKTATITGVASGGLQDVEVPVKIQGTWTTETRDSNYASDTVRVTAVPAVEVDDPCVSVDNPAAPVFSADAAPGSGWHTTVPLATATSSADGAVISYSTDGATFVSAAPTLGEGTATVTAKAADGTCSTKTSTSSREFKVDTVAPGASPASVVNSTWRNTSLEQEFTFTDVAPGSGLASGQGLDGDGKVTVTASAESADTTTPTVASVTINDIAGNSTTRSVSALIDLTKPTSSVAGVIDGAVYTQAPAVTCSGNDELSGIASDGTVSGNTATAGVKTVSCNGATDYAGNVQTAASDTVGYTLALIGGFNSNFDGSAVLRVKPNQAIPLKWAFSDGTSNLALLTGATISSVSSTRCVLGGTDAPPETASSEGAAGASGLQLLPDNSYQMNWKANSTTGCRALTVTMAGASSRTILVDIRK